MKNSMFLLTTLSLLISLSCKKIATVTNETCTFPQGIYVNTTFLSGCDQAKYAGTPFVFLEMNFRENQSVTLDNGVEKYTIPVLQTESGCRFKISNPSLFGELEFEVSGDTLIQLFDSSTTKLNEPSMFEKRTNEAGETPGFDFQMNECVLAGDFLLYKKGIQQSGFVTVLPNGQLNGLKPYLGYELCYERECLDNEWNTVYLISQSGQKESFYFKKTDGKNFIAFYPVEDRPADPALNGGSNPAAFELRLK